MQVLGKPGSIWEKLPKDMENRVASVFSGTDAREAAKDSVTAFFADYISNTYEEIFIGLIEETSGEFDIAIGSVELKRPRRYRLRRGEGKKPKDFWLAFAAFDVDFGNRVPRGRTITLQAMAYTLGFINETILRQDSSKPEVRNLIYLHYALPCLEWQLTRGRSSEMKGNALEIINRRMMMGGEKPWIRWHTELEELLGKWEMPWAAFHTLVRYKWFYDEFQDNDE